MSDTAFSSDEIIFDGLSFSDILLSLNPRASSRQRNSLSASTRDGIEQNRIEYEEHNVGMINKKKNGCSEHTYQLLLRITNPVKLMVQRIQTWIYLYENWLVFANIQISHTYVAHIVSNYISHWSVYKIFELHFHNIIYIKCMCHHIRR